MKTILTILCVIVTLSFSYASPLPQTNKTSFSSNKFEDAFTRFNGHRQQNGIALTWQFTNPNNAVCFVIQRSYDGAFFENLAEVPCNEGRNQFKDTNGVYPGFLHYRIVALMRDGSSIYSQVEIVRIVRNG
jgi:hypothetical protein